MPAEIKDNGPCIAKVQVSAFTIPTATPESDGTFEWNATTLVLVEIEGEAKPGSVLLMPIPLPQN